MNTCDIDEAKFQAMSLFNNLIKEPQNWDINYSSTWGIDSSINYKDGYRHREIAFVLKPDSLTLHSIEIAGEEVPKQPYAVLHGDKVIVPTTKQQTAYKTAKAAYDKTALAKGYKAIEDYYKAAADESRCKALLGALMEPKHKPKVVKIEDPYANWDAMMGKSEKKRRWWQWGV